MSNEIFEEDIGSEDTFSNDDTIDSSDEDFIVSDDDKIPEAVDNELQQIIVNLRKSRLTDEKIEDSKKDIQEVKPISNDVEINQKLDNTNQQDKNKF